MKITFVLGYAGLAGGVRVIATYAEALRRLGHEVTVVSTPHKRQSLRRRLSALLRWRGGSNGHSHFENVEVRHRVIDRFRPVVNDDVPDGDIVIATWWETAEWVWNLSARKGAKVYFLQGYDAHRDEFVPPVERTWRLPMHKIVVAQWLADLARDRFGDPSATLVANGVDLRQFHAPPRGKQRVPTIGLMYSPVHTKGADIAVEAVHRAGKAGPLRVIAFGSSRPKSEHRLPAGAEFHLKPAQDALRQLYSSCDAWLFSGRREGFGLPILEAMACRTPVLATPTGAAPELVGEGGGMMVGHDDPSALAQAILRTVSLTDDRWRQMSDAAWRTARSRTWERAAARFEAALRQIQRSHQSESAPIAAAG